MCLQINLGLQQQLIVLVVPLSLGLHPSPLGGFVLLHSGASSFSTWVLLNMSAIICWRVSIDCLVLLLVIGPYIWTLLGFSSLSPLVDMDPPYIAFGLCK